MWSIYNQIQFAYDRLITFIHYHNKLGKIQCAMELVNLSIMFFFLAWKLFMNAVWINKIFEKFSIIILLFIK